MKIIENVKEFHEKFELPINNINDDIPLKVRQLRINLLFEELKELAKASDCMGTFGNLCASNASKSSDGYNVNKVEELDGLCDILYVTAGASISLGNHEVIEEAFDRVQASNMSKLCENAEQVNDTIAYYVNERGMDRENIDYKPKGDKFIVYRVSDNKILKNKYYQEVKLDDLL